MGLRLEFILTAGIVGIVWTVWALNVRNAPINHVASTKELEFTNTTHVEVDTSGMQAQSFSTYGVRNKGVLTLDNLVYTTQNIQSLVAKKGKLEGDMLYLDGDVVLQEKEGYRYETQHANYNQKTEILNIVSPFKSQRGQNTMQGDSLQYDMRKKKASGTTIDSVLYTSEK